MTKHGAQNEQTCSGTAPNKDRKNNEHNRDINSKTVFQDPVLCAQFLRDNFNIPRLKHVKPEEIEDVSERYIPYLGTEFESDSVKKIRILGIGRSTDQSEEQEPPFFVSLIDHKSFVDYDVSMQLLRYMMCIWTEYGREMERKKAGCTKRKSFRYPVIMPIVYYEGKQRWTADRSLSGRLGNPMKCRKWIPDFKYEMIRLHDYSNEELLARGNEMSLIMLISKIQNSSDLDDFIHIPPEKLNHIIQNSPGHVLDILAWVMEGLCFKIDASAEERMQCVQKVRKHDMGYLFANMEHMSLQEERRKTEEERHRAEEERHKAETERHRAEEARHKAEEARHKAETERHRADHAEKQLTAVKEETINDIIELLENLGTVSQELKQKLASQEDMSLLRKWYKLAVRAQSIEEFVNLLL